jgi:sialic acid synthase SpsE
MNFEISTRIGPRIYGRGSPLVIAEIGVNHEGSIDLAIQMIDECISNGISAVKFQTYKAEKIAALHAPAYWDNNFEKTKSQRELFKKYDKFSIDDYKILSEYAHQNKILFMTTAFDLESLEGVDNLVDIHKVSSSDITNIPFLRAVGSKRKPVLLSNGASTLDELRAAIKILNAAGALTVIPLHCILNYPTKNQDAHLSQILKLSEFFNGSCIGYSDHTVADQNLTSLLLAHAFGAIVLEKHYTHNKTLIGNDHYHAFDKADGKDLMRNLSIIGELTGDPYAFNLLNQSSAIKNARRGIYAVRKITKGEFLREEDLITLRPVQGVPAAEWESVVGSIAVKDIQKDDPIREGDFKA